MYVTTPSATSVRLYLRCDIAAYGNYVRTAAETHTVLPLIHLINDAKIYSHHTNYIPQIQSIDLVFDQPRLRVLKERNDENLVVVRALAVILFINQGRTEARIITAFPTILF